MTTDDVMWSAYHTAWQALQDALMDYRAALVSAVNDGRVAAAISRGELNPFVATLAQQYGLKALSDALAQTRDSLNEVR